MDVTHLIACTIIGGVDLYIKFLQIIFFHLQVDNSYSRLFYFAFGSASYLLHPAIFHHKCDTSTVLFVRVDVFTLHRSSRLSVLFYFVSACDSVGVSEMLQNGGKIAIQRR